MNVQKPTLGSRIRSLRQERGWTLKEMSAETGIPFSSLSRIENDQLSLSYDKLLQLSERLNIGVAELFEDDPDTRPSVVLGRRSIGGAENSLRISTENYDYSYLCHELSHKRMVPLLLKVKARTLKEFGTLVSHPGEEFHYVVSGSIVVHTEFYAPATLTAGQSIYIDSGMGHAYLLADGCDDALVLGVCSSHEDDLMQTLLSIHGNTLSM